MGCMSLPFQLANVFYLVIVLRGQSLSFEELTIGPKYFFVAWQYLKFHLFRCHSFTCFYFLFFSYLNQRNEYKQLWEVHIWKQWLGPIWIGGLCWQRKQDEVEIPTSGDACEWKGGWGTKGHFTTLPGGSCDFKGGKKMLGTPTHQDHFPWFLSLLKQPIFNKYLSRAQNSG